jgi:hypothetical protein
VPIPLPLLHTLRSAGGDGKRHFESREVFLSAAENSCGFGFRLSEGATTLTLNEYPKTFSTSRSTKRRRWYRRRRREPKDDEDDAARGGSKGAAFFLFFVSPRAARRASRRSATSWMKTHTNSDSLRFPVIEKTVKPPTHLARGPTRRETRVLFFPLFRVLPSRDALDKKTRTETTSSSPVMKLQKGVSQKHHSQCPNFRVILPDSSGCPVEN